MPSKHAHDISPSRVVSQSRHIRLCVKGLIRDLSLALRMPSFGCGFGTDPERMAYLTQLNIALTALLTDLVNVESMVAGEVPTLKVAIPLDPERVQHWKYSELSDPDLIEGQSSQTQPRL